MKTYCNQHDTKREESKFINLLSEIVDKKKKKHRCRDQIENRGRKETSRIPHGLWNNVPIMCFGTNGSGKILIKGLKDLKDDSGKYSNVLYRDLRNYETNKTKN